jgi:predicted acetyltransferase
VGRKAARLLWDRYPGRWYVRVFVRNVSALEFWDGVITEYSQGVFEVQRAEYKSKEWQVFSFLSRS